MLCPVQVLVHVLAEELQVLAVSVLAAVLSALVLLVVACFPRMMKTVGQTPEVAAHWTLSAMSVQVYSTPKVVPRSAVVWPFRNIRGDRIVPLGGVDDVDDEIDSHTGQSHSFSPSNVRHQPGSLDRTSVDCLWY